MPKSIEKAKPRTKVGEAVWLVCAIAAIAITTAAALRVIERESRAITATEIGKGSPGGARKAWEK